LVKTANDSTPVYESIFSAFKNIAALYVTADPVLAIKDIALVIDTVDAWQGSRSR